MGEIHCSLLDTIIMQLHYLGGYFFDQYGSYDYAWYLSIALSFFATVVHLPIDEKPLPRLVTTLS